MRPLAPLCALILLLSACSAPAPPPEPSPTPAPPAGPRAYMELDGTGRLALVVEDESTGYRRVYDRDFPADADPADVLVEAEFRDDRTLEVCYHTSSGGTWWELLDLDQTQKGGNPVDDFFQNRVFYNRTTIDGRILAVVEADAWKAEVNHAYDLLADRAHPTIGYPREYVEQSRRAFLEFMEAQGWAEAYATASDAFGDEGGGYGDHICTGTILPAVASRTRGELCREQTLRLYGLDLVGEDYLFDPGQTYNFLLRSRLASYPAYRGAAPELAMDRTTAYYLLLTGGLPLPGGLELPSLGSEPEGEETYSFLLMDLDRDGADELLLSAWFDVYCYGFDADGGLADLNSAGSCWHRVQRNGTLKYHRPGAAPTHGDYYFQRLRPDGTWEESPRLSRYMDSHNKDWCLWLIDEAEVDQTDWEEALAEWDTSEDVPPEAYFPRTWAGIEAAFG